MPGKNWIYETDSLKIEFINSWSFDMRSREILLVNDKVMVDNRKSFGDGFRKNIAGVFELVEFIDGKPYEICVKIGSKFIGLSVGCHIYVNGELVGGDVNSKLMFV